MVGAVRSIRGTLILVTCSAVACSTFGASGDPAPEPGPDASDGSSDASSVPSDASFDASPAVNCSLPGHFCDDFESGDIGAARTRWGNIINGANLSIVPGELSGQMLRAEGADAGAGRLLHQAPGLAAPPTYLGLELDVRLRTDAAVSLAAYRFVDTDGGIVPDVEIVVRGGRVLLAAGTVTGMSSGGTIKVGEWTRVTLIATSGGVTLTANGSGGAVTGIMPLPSFGPGEVRLLLGPSKAAIDVDFDNYRFRVE